MVHVKFCRHRRKIAGGPRKLISPIGISIGEIFKRAWTRKTLSDPLPFSWGIRYPAENNACRISSRSEVNCGRTQKNNIPIGISIGKTFGRAWTRKSWIDPLAFSSGTPYPGDNPACRISLGSNKNCGRR